MHALILLVPQALVEQTSDALLYELEALSVTVDDADAGGADEQALFGEPGMPIDAQAWTRSRMSASFADPSAATQARDSLMREPWASTLKVVAMEAVPDADWVRLTQSQFDPVRITDAFWVVPTWHHAPAEARIVMRLDPGLAFGSGTHPTTRMCLQWIATRMPERPQRLLDYGCGSGILAIAAALHGASNIDAVDIDPAAVQATRDNAEANDVHVSAGLPEMASGTYDVVIANILATPLKLLAPLLTQSLTPGAHGRLLLAGVLSRQLDELMQAYAPALKLVKADECDGWVLLEGTRS